MKPRLLFDEHIPKALHKAVHKHEPTIDILRGGTAGAPPKGTIDPELLMAAEGMERMIITNDRKTMKVHVDAHLTAGRHTWGVLLLRPGYSLASYAEELYLIWHATEASEWQDVFGYIPF